MVGFGFNTISLRPTESPLLGVDDDTLPFTLSTVDLLHLVVVHLLHETIAVANIADSKTIQSSSVGCRFISSNCSRCVVFRCTRLVFLVESLDINAALLANCLKVWADFHVDVFNTGMQVSAR